MNGVVVVVVEEDIEVGKNKASLVEIQAGKTLEYSHLHKPRSSIQFICLQMLRVIATARPIG